MPKVRTMIERCGKVRAPPHGSHERVDRRRRFVDREVALRTNEEHCGRDVGERSSRFCDEVSDRLDMRVEAGATAEHDRVAI
jgi:hypothetical protein